MHSLFGTARGSNPGPFDPKSDTLTTTPPTPKITEGIARTHSPTTRILCTSEVIARVNPADVQWEGLALGGRPC